MPTETIALVPTTFADLSGWADDDHWAAFRAFQASAGPVIAASGATSKASAALLSACRKALAVDGAITGATARAFFETNFRPHRVQHGGAGLLTGYYEPVIAGSRVAGNGFDIPVFRRPPDLVNMVAESERGAKSDGFTHMRRTAAGLVPYLTRAEIETGGLAGQGLELFYFRDPVDVFFMQVQGSGCIVLDDGARVRISYDGKNGYSYTSIGRVLIDEGRFSAEAMTLDALKDWLHANPDAGRDLMWRNQSYIFFRELSGAESASALGTLNIPLQPGRSLAVDTGYHGIGTPVYVTSASLRHADGTTGAGFHRLMIAHDVGSAIKGPERGDIYFGSGDEAGRLAGITKHQGSFCVLLPVPVSEVRGP